jgi:ABC-type molybdate transport system permease subunit
MRYVTHLIVLFLTLQTGWYLVKERSFWKKAGAALVLVLLVLRLFLVK